MGLFPDFVKVQFVELDVKLQLVMSCTVLISSGALCELIPVSGVDELRLEDVPRMGSNKRSRRTSDADFFRSLFVGASFPNTVGRDTR